MKDKRIKILIKRNQSIEMRALNSLRMLKDITGQKFGRLLAIEPTKQRKERKVIWKCLCDCGKIVFRVGRHLRNGDTKSCGCLNNDRRKERFTTHGMRNTRFYNIYKDIPRRCKNRKRKGFQNYGGRGIKCLWQSFEEFKNDMYLSYQAHVDKFGEKNTTIDRIDNNGHYSKENCRWATWKEQMRNTRVNHLLTFNGKTLCIAEWADRIGIDQDTIWNRVSIYQWPIEKALTTPVKR